MAKRINRREFVQAGAAAVAATAVPRAAFGQAPAVAARGLKPVVIASSNGHRLKNGGTQTCVEKAFAMITQGADVLDAVVAGVNIVELDPGDTSVGYGGLPNADGVVQLDSCCMHGPRKRAGGVAEIEGVKTPSLAARAVADLTDHHLIVGAGAQQFARTLGFEIVDDLNTERSRRAWLEWKRRTDPLHYLRPEDREIAVRTISLAVMREFGFDTAHYYGTINCNGLSAKGEICGVTTTSGLAFKIPGRTGDSPILGAGLYVDNDAGAAGSTGRGEANLYNLCSFLIVENMRRGMHPKDAGLDALRRVAANTVEKRLLKPEGHPTFSLNFYALNARGEHAGVSMYASDYAVCTEAGAQILPTEALFPGKPAE
ncbi:MAG TPA: N(4)-(beta-N-acetylglucosaminyl)-L-asparaginase [Vicinamibacterales bacterium]|nr:N(4)-(beta-N-acetylglucosaminyl)-L-asparaginase [Vicinamibacterales bacterium]